MLDLSLIKGVTYLWSIVGESCVLGSRAPEAGLFDGDASEGILLRSRFGGGYWSGEVLARRIQLRLEKKEKAKVEVKGKRASDDTYLSIQPTRSAF